MNFIKGESCYQKIKLNKRRELKVDLVIDVIMENHYNCCLIRNNAIDLIQLSAVIVQTEKGKELFLATASAVGIVCVCLFVCLFVYGALCCVFAETVFPELEIEGAIN